MADNEVPKVEEPVPGFESSGLPVEIDKSEGATEVVTLEDVKDGGFPDADNE